MSLTKKRRNVIAWKFFLLHIKRQDTLYSVHEKCKYLSDEYRLPNSKNLYLAVKYAYLKSMYPEKELKWKEFERIYDLFWYYHVLYVFKKGITIGASSNRDIGNWSRDIGIEAIEFRKYYFELVSAVEKIAESNIWHLAYNCDKEFLEVLKIVISETSKVNSAEAGS